MIPKYRYFNDRFRGLDDKAKEALAEAYLIRDKSWDDERWVKSYAKWLGATEGRFQDEGIQKFRTMACYYWERVKTNKGDIIKKDWLDNSAEEQRRTFTRGINR